jgi:hypothetical protein
VEQSGSDHAEAAAATETGWRRRLQEGDSSDCLAQGGRKDCHLSAHGPNASPRRWGMSLQSLFLLFSLHQVEQQTPHVDQLNY